MPHPQTLPEHPPEPGDLVQLRSRRWLVEAVERPASPGDSAVVHLACADDDAQGQELRVYWRYELDRRILKDEGWDELGRRGFDKPRYFAAFFHTLRWNCVTATDPNLVQAPFRAGIKLDAYQMEPLRKALRLPRVNLFIADDTGLGKTVEAGLIARELLLRKKANRIVVASPPSVLEQWKGELEERFGLVFQILDRSYVARMRQERGFGINPWRTHSRFLVSHRLLVASAYADPMREWLGPLLPGSLLILDEAHHAAPSSGGRYGIESKFTRAVRDLSERFEHRLFLSATPHNGHSNSFATLLELLDPYRFTRGVKVKGKSVLEDVMVRRLKEDVREVQGGFPKRNVVRIEVDGLPPDAPEIVLSQLLDQYRTARDKRHAQSTAKQRAAAGLLVVGLQQRLLSSIEAFARSLRVHRETVKRHWERQSAERKGEPPATTRPRPTDRPAPVARKTANLNKTADLFLSAPGADDEHARDEWTRDEAGDEESRLIEALTEAGEGAEEDARASTAGDAAALWANEQRLLDRMQEVAEETRHLPDAKTRHLIDWIRRNQCPDLPPYGRQPSPGAPKPRWNDRRVLIFTENRAGTKYYLRQVLEHAIEHTDQADDRIEVIDGHTRGPRRKEIQRRFNARPEHDPLRILVATDAAREGLNFQAHCTDLFHFDLPWNPGRIEQRNGRIDRKLQPGTEVNCHYFVLPQRVEDRVLEVLVRKTETIKRELGSLSKVIDDNVERRLKQGIRHAEADDLRRAIEAADVEPAKKQAATEELEGVRDRRDALAAQINKCRTLLESSRKWVRFDPEPFRDALSCSLELLNLPPLDKGADADGKPVWTFPPMERRAAADPTWSATLDSLRVPRKLDQKPGDWRRDAPVRPVVFEDRGVLTDEVVHLHLEQRVAQRLLARFRSQGFVQNDLSRACLVQARDSIPRVVLLGRLSLYGQRAERLHEVLVPVTARWLDPFQRKGKPLRAHGRTAESETLKLLDHVLGAEVGGNGKPAAPTETVQRQLLRTAARDVADLRPRLDERAARLAADATNRLAKRGDKESRDLRQTLERQRERVKAELAKHESQTQLELHLSAGERRQLEADVRHWRQRLERFAQDLEQEPARIRAFYQVRAQRVEPVGLVYLWPETN